MKPDEKELNCILFAKQYHKSDLNLLLKGSLTKVAQINKYNVSSKKSFEQLWSDYGLRDYGMQYWGRGAFTLDQKRECIRYWVQELYPFEINIEVIEKELLDRASENREKYYAENPNGHIRAADPVDVLPDEIDRRFGSYLGKA